MNYQRIFLKEHYQDIHLLSICVYACDKLPKYKSQIKDIQDTWGKVAKQYHIPVLYFLGEEKTDLSGGEFINLKGVKDDYESASHKQNLGLAYIHDHVPSQFVIAVGTDTYEINRNLVLSGGGRADSVPNLEIETGEIVGAGHASTTGRFDDEQLFYLQSRGITQEEARKLVLRGFFEDLLSQIGVPEINDRVRNSIETRLGSHI
jgi:hypothetical protein